MTDKIKELLAVLDMPEEKQWTYLAKKGLMSHSWEDAQDIKLEIPTWRWESSFGRKVKDKFRAVLADLAFRLRDEAVVEYEGSWGQATSLVYKYITGAKDKLLTGAWFLCTAQPIHFIIAALIAKELAADLCDWSKGKECQMETPMEHRIDEATLKIINEALGYG